MLRGLILGVVISGVAVVGAARLLPPVDISLPAPDAGAVAVPAGSEFNKERPDTEPNLPTTESRPAAEPGQLADPNQDREVVKIDTSPISTPETPESDAALTAPDEDNSEAGVSASPETAVSPETSTSNPIMPAVDATPAQPESVPEPETGPAADLAPPPEGTEAPESPVIAEDSSPEPAVSAAPESPSSGSAPEIGEAPRAPDTGEDVAGLTAPSTDTSPAGIAPASPDTSGFAQPEISTPNVGGEEDALPNIGETAETPPEEETGPAIEAFAAPFEPANDNPRMSIVLIDGGAVIDVSVLAEFPMPVAVVVDPTVDGVRGRMAAHRDAGTEVLVKAVLPEGTTPADVEVAFQDYLRNVPQAIAVLDVPEAALQASRPRAAQVVEIVSAAGLGLITYNKGLNSGVQIAEGAGVPVALVHRDFTANAGDAGAVRRMLDQGAFRAGQAGAVVMVGILEPATLEALTDWSGGNRATSVLLAPVSATLQGK